MTARPSLSSLANRFGHFEQDGRAFRITDPATPMPWVNVICTGRYGLVVSQNGGGFSWFDDAQHNVLTRWEMDLVRDCHGKFLYLADLDDGDLWSLSPQPCMKPYDQFSCVHEVGATTFEARRRGIETTWGLTVATDRHAEVWRVRIRNTGTASRRLRLAGYFEWCCNAAPDAKREFHRLFFDIARDAGRHAIIARKNMWDIPSKTPVGRWNRPWPYVAAFAVVSGRFDCPLAVADKEAFLGKYGTPASPVAMTAAEPGEGGFGRFGDAVAALGGDFSLAPGHEVEFHYALCIADDEASLVDTIDGLRSPGAAAACFPAAKAWWGNLLAPTDVRTARPDFDLLNNHWLPYQAVSGRLWGRTGYYQQSGAFGFRDQLQDSQVWLPLDPAGCRRQILLHASRQFVDGSVHHWWHALADFGNHTRCSDDYLWLAFVTASYIRETGDSTILEELVPFVDDPTPRSLRDHCRRSIARAFSRTSERGLPFIGSCDWNDGLSAMGIEERGESVWVAMFLCVILADWERILDRPQDAALRDEYRRTRAIYAAAVNAHAWDPEGYFRYGTKDDGAWIGASCSPEGRIHLNAQTWAILADIAPPDRAAAAWEAVKSRLLTDYGPLLLHPAYTTPDATIGYVTRYAPGSRENGGVYMHAATWALAAACRMKDQDAVERIWNGISPPVRAGDAAAYHAEPYVVPGNVDGPLSDKPGRAGWTWYTGSAAWLNRVSLEWVLGIRPQWDGLIVDPCPPRSLGRVEVVRHFRGVRVVISFDASASDTGRRVVLEVDGAVRSDRPVVAFEDIERARAAGRALRVVVRWEGARAAQDLEVKAARPLGV
ncbi:MAG: glycosyl transferase family 36 [Phycisphaerae bacterium]|jgi:cellobiose phosphorylase